MLRIVTYVLIAIGLLDRSTADFYNISVFSAYNWPGLVSSTVYTHQNATMRSNDLYSIILQLYDDVFLGLFFYIYV